MKKSKIIIPALAMIAFSTAASISGAVAWFTASRQATIDAGTYAVVKTNADLACEVTAGVGTKASNPAGDANRVISLEKDYEVSSANVTYQSKLTDGSFNHTNSTFYTPSQSGKSYEQSLCGFNLSDTNLVTKLTRVTTDIPASGTSEAVHEKIYTAVTWKMSFTVSFGAVPGDVGLFLDVSASSYAVKNDYAPTTAKGFRTAFIPAGTNALNGVKKVYAPLQTTAKCTYVPEYKAPVSGVTDMSGVAYTGNTLISSDTVATLKETANLLPESEIVTATGEARDDYFGKFVFSSGTQVSLEFDVVCWFEGTDENIVNRDTLVEYQSVISTLSFRALSLK